MTTNTHDRDPFERRISSLMDAASQDLVPAPSLPSSLKRRARAQQAALIVGGVAVVLLVAVFAGAAVRALLPGPGSVSPAGSEERGSSGTYPCTVEPNPQQPKDTACVATGTFEDAEWSLVTYDSKDGFCIDLEVITPGGGGGGGGCGPDPDRPISIGVSSGDEYPDGIAYGRTTPSVARLVLERSSGPPIELELYPAPEGAPVGGSFYLVFLPDDGRALVAYDDSGDEIARQTAGVRPAAPMPESTPLGPPVPVASGTHEGIAWELRAYEESMEGVVFPCTELNLSKAGEQFGGSGGCSRVPDDQALGFSQSAYGDEYPDLMSIAGVVTPDADEVTLQLSDGSSVAIPIYRISREGDAALPFDVDFFVGFVETAEGSTLEGHLVAHDENGDVLARKRLCPDFKAGSDASCGS